MSVTKIRDAKGHSITCKDGVFKFKEGGGSIAGAQAQVETAGDLDRRVTATRLLLTGPLAFGLRKTRDNRELYLTVEGEDWGVVLTLDPKHGKQAREVAVGLNNEARKLGRIT